MLKKLASDPDASFEDTVEALADMLTLYMSMVCESCRKRLADELVRAAPIMLERANRKAEQMACDPARSPVCDIRHAKVADTATNKAAARRTIRAAIRQGTKTQSSHRGRSAETDFERTNKQQLSSKTMKGSTP